MPEAEVEIRQGKYIIIYDYDPDRSLQYEIVEVMNSKGESLNDKQINKIIHGLAEALDFIRWDSKQEFTNPYK